MAVKLPLSVNFCLSNTNKERVFFGVLLDLAISLSCVLWTEEKTAGCQIYFCLLMRRKLSRELHEYLLFSGAIARERP